MLLHSFLINNCHILSIPLSQIWHVFVFLGMAYIYRSTHESYFFISAFCRTSDYNNDTVDNKNTNNLGSYSDLDPERLNLAAISEFLLNSVASVWKSEIPASV